MSTWRAAEADFSAAEAQVALAESRLREAEAAGGYHKGRAANRGCRRHQQADEARRLARLNRARCE